MLAMVTDDTRNMEPLHIKATAGCLDTLVVDGDRTAPAVAGRLAMLFSRFLRVLSSQSREGSSQPALLRIIKLSFVGC